MPLLPRTVELHLLWGLWRCLCYGGLDLGPIWRRLGEQLHAVCGVLHKGELLLWQGLGKQQLHGLTVSLAARGRTGSVLWLVI